MSQSIQEQPDALRTQAQPPSPTPSAARRKARAIKQSQRRAKRRREQEEEALDQHILNLNAQHRRPGSSQTAPQEIDADTIAAWAMGSYNLSATGKKRSDMPAEAMQMGDASHKRTNNGTDMALDFKAKRDLMKGLCGLGLQTLRDQKTSKHEVRKHVSALHLTLLLVARSMSMEQRICYSLDPDMNILNDFADASIDIGIHDDGGVGIVLWHFVSPGFGTGDYDPYDI